MAKARALPRVTEVAPRSAERTTLAEAIARHGEAVEHLEKIRTAAGRADSLLHAALNAKEKAAEALKEARENESGLLLDELIGGELLERSPLCEAEQAAGEAKRRLERAHQARDAAKAEIENAEREIEVSKRRIDDAAGAVIAADMHDEIPQLLEEAQASQADLVSKRCVLRFLHKSGLVVEPEVRQEVRNFLRHNDDCLPGTYDSTEFERYDEHPASQVWHAAREALSRDADATLPS